MSEKEAATRVVRIGRRFGVLVMDAMIARPHVDRVLHGDRVEDHESEAQGLRRAIGAMRPEAVGPRRRSEPSEKGVDHGE